MVQHHPFFTDIIKEGTMLYDNGKHTLTNPKILSPKERANKAKIYYDGWLKKANNFYEYFEFGVKKSDYTGAIFQLHQATECNFVTILLVFTDYKPRTHDLELLNREAGYADSRFKTLFPNQTDQEKRLFTLLVRAYIDSRYKLRYSVAPEGSAMAWGTGVETERASRCRYVRRRSLRLRSDLTL